MCGLVGVFGPPNSHTPQEQVAHMLLQIEHRGRDSSAIDVLPGATVAHCRLGITGKYGRQPLHSASGRFVALINGQFYNDALRQSYVDRGYPFKTQTDSELLLSLWEDAHYKGIPAESIPSWVLNQLEGEFSCVVWDQLLHRVFLMRDRLGIKPLCYTHTPDMFSVASEAKAFSGKKSWDTTSLMQALGVQYLSADRTLFEGISQVRAGEFVVATWDGKWETSSHTWFDLVKLSQIAKPTSPEEYLEELHKSVHKRLPHGLKTAIHLSGGVDSSTILAMSAQSDVMSFCVKFLNHTSFVEHDESAVAEQTAHVLGVEHHSVPLSTLELAQAWDKACFASERIGVNGHFPAKYRLSEHIHNQQIRVSLSGEGADEILLGYPFLQEEYKREHGVPSSSLHLSSNTTNVSLGTMLPHGEMLPHSFHAIQGWVPVWLEAKLTLGQRLRRFLDPSMYDDQQQALQEWESMFVPHHSCRTRQASLMWAKASLSGYILPTLADAPEAFHSVQGRVPFLDSTCMLKGFGLSMSDLGFPQSTKKVLRDYLASVGLQHVAQRPKHPFEAPPLLSCPRTRAYLSKRFQDWSGTPIQASQVQQFVKEWENFSPQDQQLYEPVVCTLLSVQSLRDQFL